MTQLLLSSASPEQTEAYGRLLGSVLVPGSLIALQGELGGGKTCFVRGVVAAAAPESAHLVASPTFAIMHEYPGHPAVYHFDFYRLHGAGDIIELGFEEYLQRGGIVLAEWSQRLGELLPPDHLLVRFEHDGDDHRTITLESCGILHDAVLHRFSKLAGDSFSLTSPPAK